MPRKPTWEDVPRHQNGKFAKRKRVSDIKEGTPSIVKEKLRGFLTRLLGKK